MWIKYCSTFPKRLIRHHKPLQTNSTNMKRGSLKKAQQPNFTFLPIGAQTDRETECIETSNLHSTDSLGRKQRKTSLKICLSPRGNTKPPLFVMVVRRFGPLTTGSNWRRASGPKRLTTITNSGGFVLPRGERQIFRQTERQREVTEEGPVVRNVFHEQRRLCVATGGGGGEREIFKLFFLCFLPRLKVLF